MIRTQIQLTEAQAKSLQELAARQGVSMAELIRRSVDNYIKNYNGCARQDLIERAKEAAGKYHAAEADLAKSHDLYLAKDFSK